MMAMTLARVAMERGVAAALVVTRACSTTMTKRAFSKKATYTSSSSSLVDKHIMEEAEEGNTAYEFPPCDGKNKVVFRNDWTLEEVDKLYRTPLLELVFQAATVHRECHDPNQVQKCTLLSVKTGGCPEDCKYCSQSSKWSKQTGTKATPLMQVDEVLEDAKRAKEAGSTRFCLGAAWRGTSQVGPRQFGRVLKMIEGVKN